MSGTKKSAKKQFLFFTVKGKFLLMGATGVIISILVGLIGMVSISRNAKSSEMVAMVDSISVLQTENVANDALYQYYVDAAYLDATLKNLKDMEDKAKRLKDMGGVEYAAPIDEILANVGQSKENYEQLTKYHASRGFAR